jgi:hypothetical protein
VSNKTSSANSIEGIDPLETLLYHIFVAASDRVRVTELADILSVPVNSLQVRKIRLWLSLVLVTSKHRVFV